MISDSATNIFLYIKTHLLNFIAQAPDLTLLLVTQLLIAASSAVIAIWLLNQSASFISKLQRSLYQSKLSYENKNKLGKILKPLKPNAAWLFALIFAEIANMYLGENIFFRILFFDPIYVYVFYKLILLSCNYSIESPYTTTNKFISKSVLDSIHS